MIETAKERIYREKLELISDKSMWHMNFKSSTIKMMMKNAKQALELAENLPDSTDELSVEKLQQQLNTAKYFFKNILDVNPNLNKGHVSHLENCVRVMKNSAEKALAEIGVDDE
jgi:hypothetical protein